MSAEKQDKPDPKNQTVIHVDGHEYKVQQSALTGAQIKALASKDSQYQLFLEAHGNDPDRAIGDNESVSLKNGMHFYTVPPATFGAV